MPKPKRPAKIDAVSFPGVEHGHRLPVDPALEGFLHKELDNTVLPVEMPHFVFVHPSQWNPRWGSPWAVGWPDAEINGRKIGSVIFLNQAMFDPQNINRVGMPNPDETLWHELAHVVFKIPQERETEVHAYADRLRSFAHQTQKLLGRLPEQFPVHESVIELLPLGGHEE